MNKDSIDTYVNAIMQLLSCDRDVAYKTLQEIIEKPNSHEKLIAFLWDYSLGRINSYYFQCKAEIRSIAERFKPGTKEE